MANDAKGELVQRGARVVGIYGAAPGTEDEFLFTGLAPAQKLLHVPDRLSEISLVTAAAQSLQQVCRRCASWRRTSTPPDGRSSSP